MSLKSKTFILIVAMLISMFSATFIPTDNLYAASDTTHSINGNCAKGYTKLGVPLEDGRDCIKDQEGDDNIIYVYLRNIVRFLSVGVGIVVTLMIVISGIQYITSQGNPQATAGAKNRLTNAIIALFLFIFMSAILNFLIPGGIL